jgi:hypothetical protein
VTAANGGGDTATHRRLPNAKITWTGRPEIARRAGAARLPLSQSYTGSPRRIEDRREFSAHVARPPIQRPLEPTNDYLDGVVTLIGPGGQVLATQKILTVSPTSAGGAWYIPGGELRRTAVLSQNFASWARRYIPD